MKLADPTRLFSPRLRCDMQKHLLEILCSRVDASTAELASLARLTSSNTSTMLRRMQGQRLVVLIAPAKTGVNGQAARWQLRETYEKLTNPATP